MLDKISFNILTELCQDGRISNIQLSRMLGLNPSTVRKRTHAMLENGIIRIIAIPNPAKMGHHANALIFLSIDPKEVDNVCNQLKGNPHINLVVNIFGRFDLMLLANLHELEMLDKFLVNDLYRIEGINHIQMHLVSEFKKIYEGMFKDNKAIQDVSIDEIDQRLIRKLMHNGRANYAEMAKDLGISVSSVGKRIESLVKEDIIQIIGIPNPTKFGYLVDAYIAVQCRHDKIESICNRLGSFHEIHMVMTLMSDFNIFFNIRSLDLDSLYQFIKTNINTIDGILHIESFIRGNYLYFSPDAIFHPKQNQ